MKQILTILLSLVLYIPVFSQSVPSYVPTNGLVGWWGFNGNAQDGSGNGNHGTVNGATLTTDRFGNQNGAYLYSNNQTINVNHNQSLNPNINYSMSFWYQIHSDNYPANDIFIKGPNDYTNSVYFRQHHVNRHQGTLQFWGGIQHPYGGYAGIPNLSINQWQFITVVIFNGTIAVYVNNQFAGSLGITLFNIL